MEEIKPSQTEGAIRALHEKGRDALERDNLDYAIDLFSAALEKEPRLLETRESLLRARLRRSERTAPAKLATAKALLGLPKLASLTRKAPLEALATAEKLLGVDPRNPRFIKAHHEAALAAGAPEIALRTLAVLSENDPENLDLLEPLARLYRETEAFEGEYACREIIARLKPADPDARKALKDAAARLSMGRSGWRENAANRAPAAAPSPSAPQPADDRDETLSRADSLEHAAEQVARYPNDLRLKFTYGERLLESGAHTEAIAQLQQAQRDPARRVDALILLAEAFAFKAQYDIARDQLETALNEADKAPETRNRILYALAGVLEHLNEKDAAKRRLKEIYAVDIGYRDVAERVESAN